MSMMSFPAWLHRARRMKDSSTLYYSPLMYDLAPIDKRGTRSDGRLELRPRLDLTQFRTRAVIDWIELKVELGSETQPRHVSDWIARACGRRPFVKDEADNTHATARSMLVRLQEPRPETVAQTLRALQDRWHVRGTPEINAIEISIDWYVKDADSLPEAEQSVLRAQMFTLLHRHFRPTSMLDLTGDGQPRFVAEDGLLKARPTWLTTHVKSDEEETRNVLGVNVTLPRSGWAVLDLTEHKAPTVDSTIYFGAKNADLMVRIQNKVTDQRREDGAQELPGGERRARIEVTLQGAGPRQVGLEHVDDLQEFKLESLRKKIFAFSRVTVPDNLLRRGRAVDVFLEVGVDGLERHGRASSERSARLRRGWRHEEERRLPKRLKVIGGTVRLPAFDALHRRMENALTRLSGTWRRHDGVGPWGSA